MFFLLQTFNLIKDIYSDRQLVINFAKKDFIRRFSGSFLGTGWAFLQPLLTIVIYWAVFQFGFRSGDIGNIPFVLWFVCGIVPWLFISEAFPVASNSFLEYSYLVKKVVFNINILPLVKIISCAFTHLFFIGIAMFLCIIKGYPPTIYWLQIIYYLICMIIFTFALSLICASIMVFFRDLTQIIGVLLLIGMWGTPIAWNLDMFPVKYHVLFKLNPIYYLVQGYRDSLIGNIWFWEKINLTIYFWCVLFVLLFIGSFVFNHLKQYFADTL